MDYNFTFLVVAIVISLVIIWGMIQSAVDAVKEQITIKFGEFCRKLDEMDEELIYRLPEPTKDRLLSEVARWAIIGGGGLSYHAIVRHFNINPTRADKIMDQLHEMGLCSDLRTDGNRVMLIDMETLLELERAGAFEPTWAATGKNS
jgi:hypothetical protein